MPTAEPVEIVSPKYRESLKHINENASNTPMTTKYDKDNSTTVSKK